MRLPESLHCRSGIIIPLWFALPLVLKVLELDGRIQNHSRSIPYRGVCQAVVLSKLLECVVRAVSNKGSRRVRARH